MHIPKMEDLRSYMGIWLKMVALSKLPPSANPYGNFRGKARVFESQDAAVTAIITDKLQKGDVVVIRYEGPCGGPGMQEMLYPTQLFKGKEAR